MASAMPEASYSWWSVVEGDSGEDVMVEETDRIMVSSSSQFLHIPIPLSLTVFYSSSAVVWWQWDAADCHGNQR